MYKRDMYMTFLEYYIILVHVEAVKTVFAILSSLINPSTRVEDSYVETPQLQVFY